MSNVESTSEEAASESHLDVIRTVLSKWRQRFEGCSFMGRKERNRTRRPKPEKPAKKTTRNLSDSEASATDTSEVNVCDKINSLMLSRFIQLPIGIDEQEWIAHHTFSLFDHVNALCGTVSEVCTPVTCSSMSCPENTKIPFIDEKGKKCFYPAMQYIDAVMTFCEQIGRNEEVFPTKYSSPFGSDFHDVVKRILLMIWHCLGHLYESHWNTLGEHELYPQYLLVTAHLGQFCKQFDLLDKEVQAAIDDIVAKNRRCREDKEKKETKLYQSRSLHESPTHATGVLSKSHSWCGNMTKSPLSLSNTSSPQCSSRKSDSSVMQSSRTEY
ncbi:unnamed protein product [Auanema sp. JU1783]|nr:unnamed protein product [Auanema sp. JU1783]